MPKIKNLDSFLNEGASEHKTILILTARPKSSDTSDRFIEQAKKRGFKAYIIDVNSTKLVKLDDNKYKLENTETGKGPTVQRSETVVLNRRGVLSNTFTKNLAYSLEKAKFFCVNNIQSMETCENKYLTGAQLEAVGIPVPKTALLPNDDSIDEAIKRVGGKFPVVVKLLSGTQGVGVSIVDSYASLKSVYQTLKKLDKTAEILIQEMIPSDYDIRIHVLNKSFDPEDDSPDSSIIVGAMRRNRVKKDFRTNFSLGATTQKIKLTPEIEKIAKQAAKIVGCVWCGVDIIIDKKTGKPYVLEVNSSPGTKGIEKTTGISVTGKVLDFLQDQGNWMMDRFETGFREIIDIQGVGKFVAKFDTGNGSKSSSMHVDSYEVDGDTLTWKLKGKTYKNQIVGHSKAEVGKHVFKRPIIFLDIVVGGKILRDVEVSPVNREGKSTPFLANRKFMERAGIVVNPDREFYITNISSIDKNYNAIDAKGNKHAGISVDNDVEDEDE
jgi:RimK family alpha-L-glutamate ligase